jgi:8-oxo-dGTP pyrophosphatase MutT (NUDIX family)
MNQPSAPDITHHYTGVFLVTASGKVIGQQRDDKPYIDNPNRIGSFGGTVEVGEDSLAAAWRELAEETNLKLDKKDIHPYFEDVAWRKLTNEWEGRHFYYAKITSNDLDQLEIYEGQGWRFIESSDDELLIDSWRTPVSRLLAAVKG